MLRLHFHVGRAQLPRGQALTTLGWRLARQALMPATTIRHVKAKCLQPSANYFCHSPVEMKF